MESDSSYSDSYLTVERMIRAGELSLSELEHVLDVLLQQENITVAEQQALLELAGAIQSPRHSSA